MSQADSQNPNYKARPRPLSPHLQVYKPQMTSALSIFHRASIIALYFGLFGFILILADYAFIEQCAIAGWLKTSSAGQIITKLTLSFYALAASYWVCATIRHLAWDLGKGFYIPTAYKTAYISIAATVLLTFLIIYYGVL